MFSFWKAAEEKVDDQVAEIKENLKAILDEDGNIRDGVTAEQVVTATAAIDGVVENYKKISAGSKEIQKMSRRLNGAILKLRNEISNSRTRKYYDDMPLIKAALGL